MPLDNSELISRIGYDPTVEMPPKQLKAVKKIRPRRGRPRPVIMPKQLAAAAQKIASSVQRPRRVRRDRSSQVDNKRMAIMTAPVAVGMSSGPSMIPSIGYLPQKDTDFTSSSNWSTQTGVRVYGSDVMNILLYAHGSTTENVYGVVADFSAGVTQAASFPLGPFEISSRLAAQSGQYQYYAFRELLIEIQPGVTPESATGHGADNVAMGLAQDYDLIVASLMTTDPTCYQKISQIVPSVTWTAWEPASLTYKFNGKRLWECDTNSADPESYFQLTLCAATRGNNSQSTLTPAILAVLKVTYIVDFYMPTFLFTSTAYTYRYLMDSLERDFRRAVYEAKGDVSKAAVSLASRGLHLNPRKISMEAKEKQTRYQEFFLTHMMPFFITSASRESFLDVSSTSSNSSSSSSSSSSVTLVAGAIKRLK